MSFNVYEVSSYNGRSRELATEEDIVESGLSSGELRQSLMDRFREEVRHGDLRYIRQNFG